MMNIRFCSGGRTPWDQYHRPSSATNSLRDAGVEAAALHEGATLPDGLRGAGLARYSCDPFPQIVALSRAREETPRARCEGIEGAQRKALPSDIDISRHI